MKINKKAALHNLGCKVNAYETEAMQQILENAGYEIVPFTEYADVYVVNTCSVTNMADRKSRQMLHKAKKMNPDAIVVGAGCYVQTKEAEALLDDTVDIVIGNNKKHELLAMIEAYENDHGKCGNVIDINHEKQEYEEMFLERTAEHTRAFIKVQDGCNQFCSYCIIPFARGRVRSRNSEDVIREVKRLAEHGFREIVLTGIHLSSYGVDTGDDLLHLIREVHNVEGIERIRLGSLEPRIVTDGFAAALAGLPKICPHFHLSLQSGCDATLQRMNRRYDTREYEEGCQILRKYFDHPAITTDVIVGFPGETEEEFAVYKKKYKSAYKQFDKYFLFLEKAFDLLKEDGQMCYIVPNKFYKIGAGQELRRITAKYVSKLDDFGDMQLFPDKTIYSCIITLCKECNKQLQYTNVISLTDLWTGEEQENIEIKNEMLDENPWRLTTDIKFMKMIAKVEEHGKPLGEIVNIFNGIQTSAERPKPVYWFSKDEIVSEKEDEIIVDKFEKRYHIEKSILKPFFKPTKADEKGMGTYSILKTDKYIIFPYNADGSLISIDVMKKEYPGTYQYLEDCYELLVPKCLNGGKGRDIKNATADTWYQYGRTQAITAFVNTPKLIVRILSKDPMYAYDENNMLIASGGTAGYCAISKLPDSKYDLRYIQAWLNHPYTEKLFQIMGSDFEGGFTARGTYLLKKIPFVELDFNDKIQKALYESVLVSVKRIRELNNVLEQKKDKASVGVIEAEKENLSKRIEDDITKIYNLQF